MPLVEYVCKKTGKRLYCFNGEEHRIFNDPKMFIKMPPNPVIVKSTREYMVDDPVLDSIVSMYELDRLLNIEAELEKDFKAMNNARIDS
jgi:hypothetical protein